MLDSHMDAELQHQIVLWKRNQDASQIFWRTIQSCLWVFHLYVQYQCICDLSCIFIVNKIIVLTENVIQSVFPMKAVYKRNFLRDCV